MAFRDIVERTWSENHLFSVLIELTYQCNLDCYFCYNDLSLQGRVMEREEWLQLLDDLAELGVLNLSLSGGEPLAHPDFFLLGSRARELGFAVRIKSNGHAVRGALAQRIRDEIDPFLIEVSLHGARSETHDQQTRVKGSHERLLVNLAEMDRLGLRVKLNSTLTRWNEDEIEGMFEIADRFGFALQVDPEVTPRDDGDREPLSITASKGAIARLFRLQKERSERAADGLDQAPVVVARQDSDLMQSSSPAKHCGAGSSSVTVDPFGNVYPCVQWRRPIGSLHDHSIRELWTGSPALAEVRGLTAEVKRMIDGQADGASMAFCPGSAETNTGSPFELYPAAVRRRELFAEIREDASSERRTEHEPAAAVRSLPIVE